jgi:hypothetical protein
MDGWMDGPIGGEWYRGRRCESGIQRKEKIVPSPLGESKQNGVLSGAKGPLPDHSVNPVVHKSGQQM